MTTPVSTVPQLVVEIMALCREAGVRLSPDGANLRCSSSEPLTPELRNLIVVNKAAIIASLSIWDARRAGSLFNEAYDLMVKLGASGMDSEIAAANTRHTEAYANQDMAGVRAACHAIVDRARKLAATKNVGRTNTTQSKESPPREDGG